jgi:hypothetical protein
MKRRIGTTAACALVGLFAACGTDGDKQAESYMDASGAMNPTGAMDASGVMNPTVMNPTGAMDASGVVSTPVVMSSSDASPPVTANDAAPVTSAPLPLPLDFTTVDVTNNTMRRFGAPSVVVNPKDSNNIVVLVQSNLGYTKACLPPPAGSDCELIAAGGNAFLKQPRGFYKTPGFMDIAVYASSDRGKTFKQADLSAMVPPGHPEVRARGEGPISAMPDGSFFVGFNAINWGNWESQPMTFFPNGGVGVIRSTDGGITWKWMSYSFTPADWPFGGADPVTGTFYVTSGLAGLSTLGPRSNGDPNATAGTIADRWIASTQDGTKWTDPQPLGGTNGTSHVTAGHSPAAGAFGILATLFLQTDQASCSFFVGNGAPSSCVVFQTSTDAGATWTRHLVPTPAGFTPTATSVFVGADPTTKEHFTVALLDQSGADILVYQTPDSGVTWTGGVKVSEDATKTHFAPWATYSATGQFGLMWRTYEADPQNPTASAPIKPWSVWAAVSKDGGATFSQPLKVSKANSPAPNSDPNDAFSFVGDHGPSGMAMDGDGGVYVVWADWTPGERAIFFSAINSQSFTF